MNVNSVLKCSVCGNMVEVLHVGGGTVACCGQPMEVLTENTVDASKEKHIPVIEKTNGSVLVKVGSIEHPMIDTHFIQWIELIADGMVYRKSLKPGDKPEAFFEVNGDNLSAREYCNLHGLWKA
jgi:superoxide reductase